MVFLVAGDGPSAMRLSSPWPEMSDLLGVSDLYLCYREVQHVLEAISTPVVQLWEMLIDLSLHV